MNENENTATTAEELDNAPPGDVEEAAETVEEPAEATEEPEETEEPTETENDAESEISDDEEDEGVDDIDDDYDDFYIDVDKFKPEASDDESEEGEAEGEDEEEEEPEAEGGDTPSDPEGEDEDEGENEDSEDGEGAPAESSEDEASSYGSWEAEDRAAIIKAYPELEAQLKGKNLGEILDDVDLFVFMRGSKEARAKYTAVEAFEKAAAKTLAKRAAASRAKADSKAHLTAGKGKAAAPPVKLPLEIRAQRHLYPGKTDAEILNLYKKFNNN